MRLVCLEPEQPGPAWLPFIGARPIAELRAGAWRIRERWAAVASISEVAVMGDHAAGFEDVGAAPLVRRGEIRGPAIVARSEFAPATASPDLWKNSRRLEYQGRAVAWKVPPGESWNPEDTSGSSHQIDGVFLRGAWDLITALERLLPGDCEGAVTTGPDPVPSGCLVLGDPAQVGCFGAEVEPGVAFDVRHGSIVLEEGVKVFSGTRLEGPLFVGENTVLLGGVIRHSAIGPQCRVHGEVSSTVFLGYANKSHDGFLGHSVLGQWVNLGAGTITSNLKNTYGEVRLDLPGGRLATGRMFLGALLGDHAKTGIGTLLSTGTVIGTGAHVVAAPVPRYVAPFSWGPGLAEKLDLEGFITIARRVMPRRQVEVTPAIEASLRGLHARLAR